MMKQLREAVSTVKGGIVRTRMGDTSSGGKGELSTLGG